MAHDVTQYCSCRPMCLALLDGLGKLPSDIQTDWRDERAHDEGDAPTPRVQLFGRQRRRQHHSRQTSKEQCELLAVALPRGEGGTLFMWCGFQQIGRRRSDFPATGKALN